MGFKIILSLLIVNTLIILSIIIIRSIKFLINKSINMYYFYSEYVFGDGWENPLFYGGITDIFWHLFILEAIFGGLTLLSILVKIL